MKRNGNAANEAGEADISAKQLQKFHNWFYVQTLPFWQRHGVDRADGGFHEWLDAKRRPDSSHGKRLVVQARQIYVFSQASLSDLLDQALDTARHGFDFLLAHYRADGGWRHRVHSDGRSLDDRCDLYDQAFAIFALAWFYRASGDAKALELANGTLDFLETKLVDGNGGYGEGLDGDGRTLQQPRRQNPHMHLLEAYLALHDATGEKKYLNRAAELIELAKNRFVVGGSLREYFTADLKPLPSAAGRIVEPGHHFEWVWLLSRYAELVGPQSEMTEFIEKLYRFPVDHGVDPRSGGVMDQIDCDGKPLKTSRRVWPQTEALKAHAARAALAGDPEAQGRLDAVLTTLLRDHLSAPAPGVWLEQVDRNGKSVRDVMPGSTLYHLAFACSETDRLARNQHQRVKN